MYLMREAFAPEDLENMTKSFMTYKSATMDMEGDEELKDAVKDHVLLLGQIVEEYLNTWYVVDGEMVMQERDMLFDVYNTKFEDAEKAARELHESKDWGKWHQVSGDYHASVEGATFVKADRYGYEFIEVINLDNACGRDGGPYPDGVYAVAEGSIGRSELTGEKAEQALRSCGNPDSEDNTDEDIAVAMFVYGYHQQGYWRNFKTLSEAMDEFDIPQEALWNEQEYDAVWEEEAD